MTARGLPLRERLFLHLEFDPNTGCWLWSGSVDGKGYGKINVEHRLIKAHRLAWELQVGPIPAGLLVCHRCDTPACCNPAHLFLGTHADNLADMAAKGRARGGPPPGERHGRAKLTNAQVIELRASYRPRIVTCRDLAERYGVSVSAIERIVAGRNWQGVAA